MPARVIFAMRNSFQLQSKFREHKESFVMIDGLSYRVKLVFLNATNNLNNIKHLKFDKVQVYMLDHNIEWHLDILLSPYMLFRCYIGPNLYSNDFVAIS